MSNAALGIVNLIDPTATTLTSLGALTTAPVTNLRNPHVGKRWRHNTTATWCLADLGSLKSIDTVMLAGVSGTAPTFRVRLSTVDPTGAAGNAYDSGNLTGVPYYDSSYQLFVNLQSTPASARYVRVDISEAAVTYIEAGRWFVGLRSVPTTNYQAGWTRTVVRGSQDVLGVGGQTFVDLRQGFIRQQANFDFIEESELQSFIDTIFIAIKNNGHLDMLWVQDQASTNLSRDSIWGYLDSDLRASRTLIGTDPIMYSVAFSIRQRL